MFALHGGVGNGRCLRTGVLRRKLDCAGGSINTLAQKHGYRLLERPWRFEASHGFPSPHDRREGAVAHGRIRLGQRAGPGIVAIGGHIEDRRRHRAGDERQKYGERGGQIPIHDGTLLGLSVVSACSTFQHSARRARQQERYHREVPTAEHIEFLGSFTTLPAAGGNRPDVYVGFTQTLNHRILLPACRRWRQAGRRMRA